eukprot:TRINITY_DN10858_c5_g1_i1.p1 TRINITY_DN10858_c5_g1~~TRINITY_DN10858_c5_g1_i1.p1  ORF type:complete len:130 (+),score=29.63 TRINITY_DN10858_c5_g1_i1:87-476(+)
MQVCYHDTLEMIKGCKVENSETKGEEVILQDSLEPKPKERLTTKQTASLMTMIAEKTGDGEEVLVNQVIYIAEVYKCLDDWIPAMTKEVGALEKMGAIKRRKYKDVSCEQATIIPGKAVFAKKPDASES